MKGSHHASIRFTNPRILLPPPANVHHNERRFRPQLESLEDRSAPAALSLTVTALTDNGPANGTPDGIGARNAGDLRYCITQAEKPGNFGSTITFQKGLQGTIQLQSALPPLSQNTTINGPGIPGNEPIAIAGGGSNNPFRIFDVQSKASCTIDGLIIEDGYVAGDLGGRGVRNFGELTLSNDFFFFNEVVKDPNLTGGDGGAIFNGDGGQMNLYQTQVAENTAAGMGGGIYNAGILEVRINSDIYGNGADEGGGLANEGGSATIQNNSQIYGFGATSFGGGIYAGLGGVVSVSGGQIYSNQAASGGGIYIVSGNLTLTSNVAIKNNTATDEGGGLYLGTASKTTFAYCTISGNTVGNLGVLNGYYWQNGATVSIIDLFDADGFTQGP